MWLKEDHKHTPLSGARSALFDLVLHRHEEGSVGHWSVVERRQNTTFWQKAVNTGLNMTYRESFCDHSFCEAPRLTCRRQQTNKTITKLVRTSVLMGLRCRSVPALKDDTEAASQQTFSGNPDPALKVQHFLLILDILSKKTKTYFSALTALMTQKISSK